MGAGPEPARRRRIRLAFAGSALLVLGVGAGAWLWSTGDVPPPEASVRLVPDEPEVVAQGRRIYAAHCAACHGPGLEGEPDWRIRRPDGLLPAPPHDESGHTWHHPDWQLFDMTRYGIEPFGPEGYRSAMPAYEGVLSEAEIVAVLSFIKSEWPAEIRAHHGRLNEARPVPSEGWQPPSR